MKSFLPLIIVLSASFALPACSNEPKAHHVSGKVTFAGKPVPAGTVYFDPQADGPQGHAVIKNGEYNTAKDGGKGVTGGRFIVRIEGFDGNSGNDLPLGNVLFNDFQQSLELPMADSVHNFDVPETEKPSP